MKQQVLMGLIAWAVSLNSSAGTFEWVARRHLQLNGYDASEMALEQETNMSEFYLTQPDDSDHPCRIGVIINKATGRPLLRTDDRRLILHFPYSETYFDQRRGLIRICAD